MSWFSMPVVDAFDGDDGPLGPGWLPMGTTDGMPTMFEGNMLFAEATFEGAIRVEPWGPDVRASFRASSTFDNGSPYMALWLRASGLGTSSRSGYRIACLAEEGPDPDRIQVQRVDAEAITVLGELDNFIDEIEPALAHDVSWGGQVIGTKLQAWVASTPGDPVRAYKVLDYDTAGDGVKYEAAGQVGIEGYAVGGWAWTNFRAENELEGSTGEPPAQVPSFLMATGEGWSNRPMWRPVDGIWIPPEV